MANWTEAQYFAVGPVVIEQSITRLVHDIFLGMPMPDGLPIESVSGEFLDLCRRAGDDCLMKVLSYDVLYSTIKAACDMAITLIPSSAFPDGIPDVDHFIVIIRDHAVQSALARVVFLIEESLISSISKGLPDAVLSHGKVGTALHHLMIRIGSVPSHMIKTVHLPCSYLYYVANELAARLFTNNIVREPDFLVQAMRNALEYKHTEEQCRNGNAADPSKVRCLHSAAVAWICKARRQDTAIYLIQSGRCVYECHPCGPAYSGQSRLDAQHWHWWREWLVKETA